MYLVIVTHLAGAMGHAIYIISRVPALQDMDTFLALVTLLHTIRLVIAMPRNMPLMFGCFIKKTINYMYLVEDRKNAT